MFIFTIIIVGLIVGYLASLSGKRFALWLYILIAFLGALVGAMLSLGDSAILLKYGLLEETTITVLFAIIFALIAVLFDKSKAKAAVVGILIVLVGLIGLLYTDSSPSNYSGLFQEELSRAGVERVGQPIEGFSAFIYLEAFPALLEEDFDGVKSLEGKYLYDGSELVHERTAGNMVTSAEETISSEGYETLLHRLSGRLNVDTSTEAGIAKILEKLREGDPGKASYINDDFSIWAPEGWYAYENGPSIFFSRDDDLEIPFATEGFAMGPWFQVSLEKVGIDELFAQNLWTEDSEFLVSKEYVLVKGIEGVKVVTLATGSGGEVLHYVFNPDEERVFVLSQYPFVRNSKDTNDFERAVATFQPNFVFEGE
jgi:hypothetical protein